MEMHTLRKLRLLFEDFPKNHNIVLVGQTHLLHNMALKVNEDIKSRVTYSTILKKLNPDAMESFITNQLDLAGLSHNTFSENALALLVRSSDGIVRKARKRVILKRLLTIGTSGPIIGRCERGEMIPSVEVAKKLANAFGATMDYLVDRTGSVAEVKDKTMLKRLMEIERLDQEDKKTIVHVIDSLLRDAKAKKAYAVQE